MARKTRGIEAADIVPWVALLGGVGLVGYLVLKPKSTQEKVAASILADPTKAAQVPGETTQQKYDWLVKAGTGLLETIGVLPKTVTPVVTTAASIATKVA